MNARIRAVLFLAMMLGVAGGLLSAQKKSAVADKKSTPPVLQAMKDELAHSLDALKG